MEAISVIIGTEFVDEVELAISTATADISDVVDAGAEISEVSTYDGGGQHIGVEFLLVTETQEEMELVERLIEGVDSMETWERVGITPI